MSQPFVGEIKIVAFPFAPAGWAFCDGQILPIEEYLLLYIVIGTTYGGDGEVTFALPDMRGRRAYHPGQGIGLSAIQIGETSGSEHVTLNTAQMPAHTHPVQAVRGGDSAGPTNSPAGASWADEVFSATQNTPYTNSLANTTMSSVAIGGTGGSAAHENRPPFLVLNFIIALFGVFPSN